LRSANGSDGPGLAGSCAPPPVPKQTIPAPSMVHYRSGVRAVVDESVYPDVEEFWSDVSAAYAAEVKGLADLGCGYLQIDDTSLAYLNDPGQRAYIAARGEDPAGEAARAYHVRRHRPREPRDRRPGALAGSARVSPCEDATG
jgi:hypothetical protein